MRMYAVDLFLTLHTCYKLFALLLVGAQFGMLVLFYFVGVVNYLIYSYCSQTNICWFMQFNIISQMIIWNISFFFSLKYLVFSLVMKSSVQNKSKQSLWRRHSFSFLFRTQKGIFVVSLIITINLFNHIPAKSSGIFHSQKFI